MPLDIVSAGACASAVASSSLCSGKTAAIVGGAVAAASIGHVLAAQTPATLEGDIQKRILEFQLSMKEARTWEDALACQVGNVSELVSQLQDGLDDIFQASLLDDDAKVQTKAAMDRFACLLKDTMSLGPDLRKLCLSRQLGSKYLKKLVSMYKGSGEVDQDLLGKAIAKFSHPCTFAERELEHIMGTAVKLARDMDSLSRQLAGRAARIKQDAVDALNAAEENVRGCIPGCGKLEAVTGACSALCLFACLLLVQSHPCGAVACAVASVSGGVYTVYRCRQNARAHAACTQERAAASVAHEAACEKSLRLNDLHERLRDAKEVLGPQQTQMLLSIVHTLLLNIGIDTDMYKEELAEDILVEEFLSSPDVQRDLDEYAKRNNDLIKNLTSAETRILQAAEKLMGRPEELQLQEFPSMIIDVQQFMEPANHWKGFASRLPESSAPSDTNNESVASRASVHENSHSENVQQGRVSRGGSSSSGDVSLGQYVVVDTVSSASPSKNGLSPA
eukprot:TRINITY_DN14337_c0_g1_i1.p1 TRINITY_DN14337_c0_g1~~TRINITY_DN14337_c0_g1_i1.p1  ORF type:complete len:506 (+),score=70.73 TRINITY_DN14337_c0_g1_i1:100-1617(+)